MPALGLSVVGLTVPSMISSGLMAASSSVELVQRHIIFVRLKLLFDIRTQFEDRVDQILLHQRVFASYCPLYERSSRHKLHCTILAGWCGESTR